MSDLIERLRSLGKAHDDMAIGEEAADEIIRLRGYLETVAYLLTPFKQEQEWASLTKEEVSAWELPDRPTVFEFAQFVEAKVKEKGL